MVVRSQARTACARDWLAFLVWRKDGEEGNREPSNPTLTFPVGFGFLSPWLENWCDHAPQYTLKGFVACLFSFHLAQWDGKMVWFGSCLQGGLWGGQENQCVP